MERQGLAADDQPVGKPNLTEDEVAVIEEIRGTRFGEVVAEIRQGRIVNIARRETKRPPSLRRQQVQPN